MADEKEDQTESKPSVTELSAVATANRMGDIADEIRRVAGKDKITPEDDTYLDELRAEFDELDEHRKKQERRALIAKVDASTKRPLAVQRSHSPRELDDDPFGEPDSIRAGGVFHNPHDESEMRTWGKTQSEIGSEYQARAYSAIEKMAGTNDHRREAMTNIIAENDNDRGDLSKLALRSSSPHYVSAFVKASKGRESEFTAKERAAVEAVRAMSLTDSAGGYLVPFQLDPTVIITSDGSRNQIRQAARQVIATGDVWNGVSSGAVSWSWDAEGAEVSDDTTTFAQPTIPIYKAAGFVPISREALQDEANVAAEVGRLLAFGKDTLENTAFATGAGTTEPIGIVTALSGAGTLTATIGTFALADVYTLDGTPASRYAGNGSWLMNRGVVNLIRQFDTAGGAGLLARLGEGQPTQLLGRPLYEAEAMSSTISAGEFIAVFGDFDNYVIADRIGVTVDFIPHLFHTTTNRPSGQSGWYASYRVGADSVNDSAFALLEVRTS